MEPYWTVFSCCHESGKEVLKKKKKVSHREQFNSWRTRVHKQFRQPWVWSVLASIPPDSGASVGVHQRAPPVWLQAGPAERGHPGWVCGWSAGMQQHGGRPQGECPSHRLGQHAIHPSAPCHTCHHKPLTGKVASTEDIWNRLVFLPKAFFFPLKMLSLWFHSTLIHLQLYVPSSCIVDIIVFLMTYFQKRCIQS